ncbi:MAG: DUF2189 domain-containing protein [Thiohalomonadaceae bacterium]
MVKIQRFGFSTLGMALTEGWQLARQTRFVSSLYALLFALCGAIILGLLLARGLTPFIIMAAGAFMLVAPIILAGFFGIAHAHESGAKVHLTDALRGFVMASPALWVVALVCALLFMIFITDAAILYSYMVGGVPVWSHELLPTTADVQRFLLWGSVSGVFMAFLIYCVAAFSVPLLYERRTNLVTAVATSVHIVFANFIPALVWAIMLSSLIMGSILLLPLLLITLPWLAFASRSLYRHTLPE